LTADFLDAVSQYTVTDGNPEKFTARPRADRVYPNDESERQSAEEAKFIDQAAKQFGSKPHQLVDDAKRHLRP